MKCGILFYLERHSVRCDTKIYIHFFLMKCIEKASNPYTSFIHKKAKAKLMASGAAIQYTREYIISNCCVENNTRLNIVYACARVLMCT